MITLEELNKLSDALFEDKVSPDDYIDKWNQFLKENSGELPFANDKREEI